MIRSPVASTATIGRTAELNALIDRLDRTIDGSGALILLGGDAGIGKSTVVRELKREATTRKVRVIEGRCSSTESSVPYAPLMDALRFRISKGEGKAVAEMLGPLREVLAPIFPQLGQTESEHESERERNRPFDLIFGVLQKFAEDPMLLVLEDVHWADQTSLELLHRLAHRASSMKLLTVATYRTDELHAAHPLRKLLGSLARDRVGIEMRIGPLDRDQT